MSKDWPSSEKSADSLPARWRRSSWPPAYHRRGGRWIRAVATVAVVVGTFHCLTIFSNSRQALKAKYTPTLYSHLPPQEAADKAGQHWRSDDYDNAQAQRDGYSRETLLANRHEWQKLGSGYEGETFTYGNVVIKDYKVETAPLRDCMPGANPELRWPTEIAASLMLGGMAESASVPEDAMYLPVVDYFLSQAEDGQPQAWHFLTPYLPAGNLANLAESLRDSGKEYTARDLDIIFRPSFNRMLEALDNMHTKHDLCHDDVKLDNIFLASSKQLGDGDVDPNEATHWLLADLGNVRQPDHPYHSSILWSSLNQNLPDCRANDVVRLIKSYTLFLRNSVSDTATFDIDFFAAAEPWSRLFWTTYDARHPVTAADTIKLSADREMPTNGASYLMGVCGRTPPGLRNSVWRAVYGWEGALAKATHDALRVSAEDSEVRWWGAVSTLGIPVGECEAGQ